MEELWKPITCLNYYDKMTASYEASNLGRIRNKRTQRVVKYSHHNTGYPAFHYRYRGDDGRTRQTAMLWHRVIALTWIPNPDNLPQIDHINRDTNDNRVENLRWVSPTENAKNTGPKSKLYYSRYSPTEVVDREGNVIDHYNTLIEACEVYGVRIPHALEMLHGRRPPKKWGTFKQEPKLRK